MSNGQSPLSATVLSSILNNNGFRINPVLPQYVGESKTNTSYTFGSIITDTVLRMLVWSINDAYNRGVVSKSFMGDTYDKLIDIGQGTIPALGNAKPASYFVADPSGVWTDKAQQYGQQRGIFPSLHGPANSGYASIGNTDHNQQATWLPWTGSGANPNSSITQWGYLRLHALQAWNEFNWNGTSVTSTNPDYTEFVASFMAVDSFISYSNKNILTMANATQYRHGMYSNMDDMITADISGVSLALRDFGQDLIDIGNAIDLSTIDSFGLPSNLLQNLYKHGAITEELVLALLSTGLTSREIDEIAMRQTDVISMSTQQKLYSAFLLITGEALHNICTSLKCRTLLNRLSDMLNLRKLFYRSYSSLTVPIYNTSGTNSKTYYLIFRFAGINPQIHTAAISSIVGTHMPTSLPMIKNDIGGTQTVPVGFGSYLYGIVPQDIAISAGAFAYSMMQIKNIKECNIEEFAQVVSSLELTTGLPLAAPASPTNPSTMNSGRWRITMGSGPHGTYTFSDFFGCMSSLPYQWAWIYARIKETETEELYRIYRDLYLAVTWQESEVTVEYDTYEVEIEPEVFETYYHITGVNVTAGGGWGREDAPYPIITIEGGSNAVAYVTSIGSDDKNLSSFGRIVSTVLLDPGTDTTTEPTATIECPPITMSPVNSIPGTVGWPGMNMIVETYIDLANAEIANIQSKNQEASSALNAYWNICGSQLLREQRSRYVGIPPVEIAASTTELTTGVINKAYFTNLYPETHYAFIDSIPSYALDTKPHMATQTLEAIADYGFEGGQALVALLRERRNADRLSAIGIPLDNQIPESLTQLEVKQLITNGLLPDPEYGYRGDCTGYTIPAWPTHFDVTTGNIIYPVPTGIFSDGLYKRTTSTSAGDIIPILTECGDIAVGPIIPTGPEEEPDDSSPPIIADPPDVVPPELDPDYTDSGLLPGRYNISDAINRVIECNCDCWEE